MSIAHSRILPVLLDFILLAMPTPQPPRFRRTLALLKRKATAACTILCKCGK